MAVSNRARRIQKELEDIAKDKACAISVAPVDPADMTHLRGTFTGPEDTPYHGGTYHIDINIPATYPFHPPHMKFLTRIWHPNISSQTGAICLDTLSNAWSPVLTIKSALLSLQSLLCTPEPKDPQDAEVARMYMSEPDEYTRKAHEWAVVHAGAPRKENPAGPSSGKAGAETAHKKQRTGPGPGEEVEDDSARQVAPFCFQTPKLPPRSTKGGEEGMAGLCCVDVC